MRAARTLALLLPLLLAACHGTPVIDTQRHEAPSFEENVLNANKVVAAAEETQMDAYEKRHGWAMTRLGDGVRLQETNHTHGPALQRGNIVAVTYRLEALDGTLLYDGQTDTLTLGRQQPCPGLDHALTLLHEGSKARVLVPSAMGFGAAGDGDRVPPRTVLVYLIMNTKHI